jgi:uncharacterized protein YggU (UPF0235/DUF167 family)
MIFEKTFSVIIKPGSNITEYNGIDKEGRHLINIKEEAINNKANIALIKFLKKKFKINVKIKKGLKCKNKVLERIQ